MKRSYYFMKIDIYYHCCLSVDKLLKFVKHDLKNFNYKIIPVTFTLITHTFMFQTSFDGYYENQQSHNLAKERED